MTEETRNVLKHLRDYFCGARAAASYNKRPTEDEDVDLDYSRGLLDGYKEGIHDGYEAALGILETIEDQLKYGTLDKYFDEDEE